MSGIDILSSWPRLTWSQRRSGDLEENGREDETAHLNEEGIRRRHVDGPNQEAEKRNGRRRRYPQAPRPAGMPREPIVEKN